MSFSVRNFLGEFDVERFLSTCQIRTKLPRELLTDAMFEVLGAILMRAEQPDFSFPNQHAFLEYLRKSTVRAAQKKNRASQLSVPWSEDSSFGETTHPEQEWIALLDRGSIRELIETSLRQTHVAKEVFSECQALIQCILSAPDVYIQPRQSGEHRGMLVFQFSKLAQAMRWNRQRVRDRLTTITRACSSRHLENEE